MLRGRRAGLLAYLSQADAACISAKGAMAYRHVPNGIAYRFIFGLYFNCTAPHLGHIHRYVAMEHHSQPDERAWAH